MAIFNKGTLETSAPRIPAKSPPGHAELVELYYRAEIRPERMDEVRHIVGTITKNQARYVTIENNTGVPWHVVAAIHSKEASLDFGCYLGNGEKIIGTDRKSTLVPAGRGPFKTFEDGAIEALGQHKHDDWSLGGTLWFCECYNGLGYRSKGIPSPYLFSGTVVYTKGGYPRDHVWDPNYVMDDCGVAAIFRGMGLFPRQTS